MVALPFVPPGSLSVHLFIAPPSSLFHTIIITHRQHTLKLETDLVPFNYGEENGALCWSSFYKAKAPKKKKRRPGTKEPLYTDKKWNKTMEYAEMVRHVLPSLLPSLPPSLLVLTFTIGPLHPTPVNQHRSKPSLPPSLPSLPLLSHTQTLEASLALIRAKEERIAQERQQ